MNKNRDQESQALIELFAKRLRDSMENREIKAADLARLSGVSKGMISLYLRGEHEPGQLNTSKMAQVLGVSPAWLMGLNSEPVARFHQKDILCKIIENMDKEKIEALITVAKAMHDDKRIS